MKAHEHIRKAVLKRASGLGLPLGVVLTAENLRITDLDRTVFIQLKYQEAKEHSKYFSYEDTLTAIDKVKAVFESCTFGPYEKDQCKAAMRYYLLALPSINHHDLIYTIGHEVRVFTTSHKLDLPSKLDRISKVCRGWDHA